MTFTFFYLDEFPFISFLQFSLVIRCIFLISTGMSLILLIIVKYYSTNTFLHEHIMFWYHTTFFYLKPIKTKMLMMLCYVDFTFWCEGHFLLVIWKWESQLGKVPSGKRGKKPMLRWK